jgi:hypothetical protein
MRPLLARLVARVAACIVTTPCLGEQIEKWGGRALVVHEAPMPWSEELEPRERAPEPEHEHRLLFICTFAPDEPLMETLEAARQLPGVTFQITGDLRKLPAEAKHAAPANVCWMGYLTADDYVAALAGADVILSLTRRSESVARSAHEAVDALRPLVLTALPHMRELFPHAVFVENDAGSIAAGVAEAFRRCQELIELAPSARTLQRQRWRDQLIGLSRALAIET